MQYELIVTRTQPPCGGKPPKIVNFYSVETDDPLGFVFRNEPDITADIDYDVDESTEGMVVITFQRGAQQVRYEFLED